MPKTYRFTLSADDVESVARGLTELPYRIAQPLLANLKAQIDKQQPAPPPAPEPATKPAKKPAKE